MNSLKINQRNEVQNLFYLFDCEYARKEKEISKKKIQQFSVDFYIKKSFIYLLSKIFSIGMDGIDGERQTFQGFSSSLFNTKRTIVFFNCIQLK